MTVISSIRKSGKELIGQFEINSIEMETRNSDIIGVCQYLVGFPAPFEILHCKIAPAFLVWQHKITWNRAGFYSHDSFNVDFEENKWNYVFIVNSNRAILIEQSKLLW